MNFPTDISNMHHKYGIYEWIHNASPEYRRELMRLRMVMLGEEYAETNKAFLTRDKEELIDGLIDICVIALGTLDIMDVNAYQAWRRVMEANMKKVVGVKEGRPNPLGLPDLVKPPGWTAPSHKDNQGRTQDYL